MFIIVWIAKFEVYTIMFTVNVEIVARALVMIDYLCSFVIVCYKARK